MLSPAVKQIAAYVNITKRKLDIDWGEEFLIGCEKLIRYRIENEIQDGFPALTVSFASIFGAQDDILRVFFLLFTNFFLLSPEYPGNISYPSGTRESFIKYDVLQGRGKE